MSADSPTHAPRRTAVWLRVYRALAWLTQPKFTLGSMVALRRPTGELLLIRQRFRAPSLWGFPGGFQKSGENAADAARRELREEVGLDVAVRTTDQVAQYQQPWARHVETVFAVDHDDRAAPARRVSLEVLEVGWFRPERLPPLTREALLAMRHLEDPARSE